jgi:hypothetical protein
MNSSQISMIFYSELFAAAARLFSSVPKPLLSSQTHFMPFEIKIKKSSNLSSQMRTIFYSELPLAM